MAFVQLGWELGMKKRKLQSERINKTCEQKTEWEQCKTKGGRWSVGIKLRLDKAIFLHWASNLACVQMNTVHCFYLMRMELSLGEGIWNIYCLELRFNAIAVLGSIHKGMFELVTQIVQPKKKKTDIAYVTSDTHFVTTLNIFQFKLLFFIKQKHIVTSDWQFLTFHLHSRV